LKFITYGGLSPHPSNRWLVACGLPTPPDATLPPPLPAPHCHPSGFATLLLFFLPSFPGRAGTISPSPFRKSKALYLLPDLLPFFVVLLAMCSPILFSFYLRESAWTSSGRLYFFWLNQGRFAVFFGVFAPCLDHTPPPDFTTWAFALNHSARVTPSAPPTAPFRANTADVFGGFLLLFSVFPHERLC